MELDEETLALLGTSLGVFQVASFQLKNSNRPIFRGRWTKRTTSDWSELPPLPVETRSQRYQREKVLGKSAAWKAAHKKYRSTAKGQKMVAKRNKKYADKLKADPVKHAARLKSARDNYAKRKQK